MKLNVAQLVPGSETPTGEGQTAALRCTIELPDASRRAAVLKRGPLGQVAAEAFSALLLRAWGLDVPEPFLVQEPTGPAFASADLGYPSLRHRLGLGSLPAGPEHDAAVRLAMLLACALRSAPLAAAADEAIANRDRNLGNILWDGAAEAWIDHAYALGQGPADLADTNKLCVMAVASGPHDEFLAGSVGQAMALDRAAPDHAAAALPPGLQAQPMASQVAVRVAALAAKLLARFPQPADLLSGA